MKYLARKRCTRLSQTTIFDNRILPGRVRLYLLLRKITPACRRPGEGRRPGFGGAVLAFSASNITSSVRSFQFGRCLTRARPGQGSIRHSRRVS